MLRFINRRKNKLYFLLLLIFQCSFSGVSQNLTFRIVSKETSKALPFVSVYLKQLGKGVSTNIHGKGEIVIGHKQHKQDTLICSYVGFETIMLPVDLSKTNQLNITMQTSQVSLAEVKINVKKQLNVNQILRRLIRNIPNNYSTEPTILSGLYREYATENDNYFQLNEAVADVYYTGYPQKYDRNIWQDWIDDDTYALDLEGQLFDNVLHHFNTKEDKANIIQARSSDNLNLAKIELAPTGGVLELTSLDLVKYKYDFLNPSNFSKYHYELLPKEYVNGNTCYTITFYPNQTNKKMHIDMAKKLDRSIYVGKLYVDVITFAVVKMQYQLAKNVNFGFFEPRVPLNYIVTTTYAKYANFWGLKNIKLEQIRFGYFKMFTGINAIVKGTREFFINGIQADTVKQIAEEDNWKHTIYTSLRYLPWVYDSMFWLEYEQTKEFAPYPAGLNDDMEIGSNLQTQFKNRFKQKLDLPAPKAKQETHVFEYPFDTIYDNYFWMADKKNSVGFYAYLNDENNYAKNYEIGLKHYKKNFYKGINNFYLDPDVGKDKKTYKKGMIITEVDTVTDDFILYECQDSLKRKNILNLTKFKNARGANCRILDVTFKDSLLGIQYTMNYGHTRQLIITKKSSSLIIDSVANVSSYTWYGHNLIYAQENKSKRSDKLFVRDYTTSRDSLMYIEKDSTYDLTVEGLKNYIVLKIQSKDETENHLIAKKTNQPTLNLVQKREKGVSYSIKEFGDTLYALTNKDAINKKVCVLRGNIDQLTWHEIVPPSDKISIDDFFISDNYKILRTLKKGQPNTIYSKKQVQKWATVPFNSPAFYADIRVMKNDSLLIHYTNPNHAGTTFYFDLNEEHLTTKNVVGTKYGFDLKYVKTKRVWVKSCEGTKVPITILKSNNPRKTHKGLILRVYGAYGGMNGYGFNEEDVILLKDGFTIVYAHVRGSGVLGDNWYADGKLTAKQNSFYDYIACAEYLIKKEYTDAEHLIGYGTSAGALTVAVAINWRPELFNTVILDHPYVDVLTTMMIDTLPLTTDEYKEWGNPSSSTGMYEYIRAYSPFQNIKKQKYPNILLTCGTHDFQTPAWQVAKYVAKLREYNTGKSNILFISDLQGGHSVDASGNEWKKTVSLMYGFVYDNIFDQR